MASMDMHTEIYQGTASAVNGMALNVQAITTDTTVTGNAINTEGFESLEFLIFSGAHTDGTFTPALFESDTNSFGGATAVDLNYVLGDYADSSIDTAETVTRLGYVGKKQYVWLTLTSTVVTSGATLGAIAVLGYAHEEATAYP